MLILVRPFLYGLLEVYMKAEFFSDNIKKKKAVSRSQSNDVKRIKVKFTSQVELFRLNFFENIT